MISSAKQKKYGELVNPQLGDDILSKMSEHGMIMPLANLPPADILLLVSEHVSRHHRPEKIPTDPWHYDDYNVYWAHALYLLGLREQNQKLEFPALG